MSGAASERELKRMGDLILADFKSKTYHKLPTRAGMEEMIALSAVEIMSNISGDFVGIPYGGAGIDGMPYPPKDSA